MSYISKISVNRQSIKQEMQHSNKQLGFGDSQGDGKLLLCKVTD